MFIGKIIERMEQNQEITDKIMNEDRFADAVRDLLLKRVYSRLQKIRMTTPTIPDASREGIAPVAEEFGLSRLTNAMGRSIL